MSLTVLIIIFAVFNFVCMICGALTNAVEARYETDIITYNIRYLFSDYFNFLANLFFGKKYFVKVNGVWSAWRGRRKRNGNLVVRYGVDKHRWELSEDNYKRCKETSDETIRQMIIDLNVRDLQASNPKFVIRNNRLNGRWARLRGAPERERLDNFIMEDIDRQMRRMLATADDLLENT